MEKNVLNEMFENLLHIGNKTNYWNPRMKEYIYGSVNGIHVINLVKTDEKIEEVYKKLEELHKAGKKILFVGTKLQARDAVEKIAAETGHYYVVEKWVPGLLTNFKTIKRRISTYLQLDKDLKSGALDMLTKKEKAGRILELEKLDRAYRGVKDMKKTPDVIFVIDGVYEDQAIKEANSLNIVSFAILGTNGDDTIMEDCIPANTNAVKSIEYILKRLKGALTGKVVAPQVNKTVGAGDGARVKKIEDKKVSGDKGAKKTTPTKKELEGEEKVVSEEKLEKLEEGEEVKKEEKKEEKKAPAKKPASAKKETKKTPAKKEGVEE